MAQSYTDPDEIQQGEVKQWTFAFLTDDKGKLCDTYPTTTVDVGSEWTPRLKPHQAGYEGVASFYKTRPHPSISGDKAPDQRPFNMLKVKSLQHAHDRNTLLTPKMTLDSLASIFNKTLAGSTCLCECQPLFTSGKLLYETGEINTSPTPSGLLASGLDFTLALDDSEDLSEEQLDLHARSIKGAGGAGGKHLSSVDAPKSLLERVWETARLTAIDIF